MDLSTKEEILARYRKSSRRLFLLDYDGTLVGFKPRPELAAPTPHLREILQRLGEDPNATVVIVSGRDHETLGQWLGYLPLHIAAEYGQITKASAEEWRVPQEAAIEWKPAVRVEMERVVRRVPGSLVEEKVFSLVWNYRGVEAVAGRREASGLMADLAPVAARHGLVVMEGKNVVEVMVSRGDKTAVARGWLARDAWDFVMAAGDDVPDEEMFATLPAGAVTVKVGGGATAARYRLEEPEQLVAFLDELSRP